GEQDKTWEKHESGGDSKLQKEGKFREKGKSGEKSSSVQIEEKRNKKPASGLFKNPVSDYSRPEVEIKEHIQRKNMKDLFAESSSDLSDKEEVISKLINLSSDPDPQRRKDEIEALLATYSRYTGKTQDIWNELLNLAGKEETGTRRNAADLLSEVFPEVEEKSTVFFDLVRLTESQDTQLRRRAAELLATAFAYCENKQAAWNELVKLVSVEDREVRKGAILALSSGYKEVPDKEKAWKDLLSFSDHSDSFVQRAATRTLGSAFFYMTDKTQAWRDLQALTDNPYVYVRKYAFRSLGKASFWRALRAENEATYIFGLKEAVNYFKEASETSIGPHIPEFYYPFYQALLFILFSDRPGIAKLESEQYLSKMTDEVKEQAESQKFLEIFGQFAGLLTQAGELSYGDLSGQKKLLEVSILLFDQFSSLFESKEEEAIFIQKSVKKEKPVKKEYSNLGKALLERVEKKKASLTNGRKKNNF
ncbi:MAG TPA: HEAT repeat domain-containing protein, partial [Methanosarcina sp.]|nr:HEAT repeat domain-containing protein [Methanosarcina sp.]